MRVAAPARVLGSPLSAPWVGCAAAGGWGVLCSCSHLLPCDGTRLLTLLSTMESPPFLSILLGSPRAAPLTGEPLPFEVAQPARRWPRRGPSRCHRPARGAGWESRLCCAGATRGVRSAMVLGTARLIPEQRRGCVPGSQLHGEAGGQAGAGLCGHPQASFALHFSPPSTVPSASAPCKRPWGWPRPLSVCVWEDFRRVSCSGAFFSPAEWNCGSEDALSPTAAPCWWSR